MAKYTREQRQRAVELYVKYECCAADVIRELGYPSREALRMWHRDWLDEQETGVSSQRGERYARYTEEQKRAAVDHYLTHGRRASRTMRQMGYPSKEVLASWSPWPGSRGIETGCGPEGRVRRIEFARGRGGGGCGFVGRAKLEASTARRRERTHGDEEGTGTRGFLAAGQSGRAARRASARRTAGHGDPVGDHEGCGGTGGKRAGRRPGQPDKPREDDPDQGHQ